MKAFEIMAAFRGLAQMIVGGHCGSFITLNTVVGNRKRKQEDKDTI